MSMAPTKRILPGFVLIMVLHAGMAFASDEGPKPAPILSGYGVWQFGQIVKGDAGEGGGLIDHQWTTSALLGLRLSEFPASMLEVVLSPEFKLYYPFPERSNVVSTVRPNSVAYVNEAQGIFSFGGQDKPLLRLNIGMFDYKYNPESRNLGEYLFRTGTYSPWVITDFDFAAARLLGLRARTLAIDNLRLDLLVTSEYQFFPLYDFSVSLIAAYRFFNVFDIGAGVMDARCFPANEKKTSPKFNDGSNDNFYVTRAGDTGYYSFQATKFMARACFDPKGFFPSVTLFGSEDLKLYAEAAVIGIDKFDAVDDSTHHHPAYYNDIKRRIPVMFGFNVPAFKILDVFSVEAEYFHSGLPNNYRRQEYTWTPMPYVTDPASYDPKNYTDPGLRWSVYAKRSLVHGFTLAGQVAFDHLRTTFQDGANAMEECMLKPGHWYWVFKTTYSF